MSKFKQGDRARINGEYWKASGTIVAAFLTADGHQRYVLEFDVYMIRQLHIFKEDDIQLLTSESKYSAKEWHDLK